MAGRVTAPPTPEQDPDTRDLLIACRQLSGMAELMAQIMDNEVGTGWYKPGKGRRRVTVDHGLRLAWGQAVTTWLNIAHHLVRERGVASWEIPVMFTRRDGERPARLELDSDGRPEWSDEEDMPDPDLIRNLGDPVRPVGPAEPRYTLEQARKLLELCQQHHWEVQLSELGAPLGVRCTNCDERRPIR